jgi:hypothetical protein
MLRACRPQKPKSLWSRELARDHTLDRLQQQFVEREGALAASGYERDHRFAG